jgi:hypothetical protein
VRLYSYSSELLTFAESKRTRVRFVSYGILIGSIVFIGFIRLSQFERNTVGSRTANSLKAENSLLHHQWTIIASRVSRLELLERQYSERAEELSVLLHRNKETRKLNLRIVQATKPLAFGHEMPVAVVAPP